MPLDLSKVALQIDSMVTRLREDSREQERRVASALEALHGAIASLAELKSKVAASKTSWLVAEVTTGLVDRCAPAPPPASYTAAAADGSSIDVDRHRSPRCYLINLGSSVISYGAKPDADLDSLPRVCSLSEDMVLTSPQNQRNERPIEGPLLAIKRGVDECRHLAGILQDLPAGGAYLALLDGSLILWTLTEASYPEFVIDALLDKGFLGSLEVIRKLNADRRLAVAGYISFSRSADVANLVKVALCPDKPVDCDRCSGGAARACDAVSGVLDQHIFSRLLAPGERSALFISPSKVQKHYGEHRVHFFYLNTCDEIARVEVPAWVAADASLLEMTHSLVLDQCRRGQGYPVCLSEAHEQAVLTMSDRERFWTLMEASMADGEIPAPTSGKRTSKQTRWI
ncbi:MAG: DNA double-strand break repair nuclease NurA [Chloroflexi bacterium]|nr:DNA double-strand break repair nuclease NurA [Chloroflexota bacterium]